MILHKFYLLRILHSFNISLQGDDRDVKIRHYNGYTLFVATALASRNRNIGETADECRRRVWASCKKIWSEQEELRKTWAQKAIEHNRTMRCLPLQMEDTIRPAVQTQTNSNSLLELVETTFQQDTSVHRLPQLVVHREEEEGVTAGYGPLGLGDDNCR